MGVYFDSVYKIVFDDYKNGPCAVDGMNDRLGKIKSTEGQSQWMDTDASASNEKILVIGWEFEFHAEFEVADEEKVDEKGSETSEEIGLNWMKALFIGVDESKDEDVVSNNDK